MARVHFMHAVQDAIVQSILRRIRLRNNVVDDDMDLAAAKRNRKEYLKAYRERNKERLRQWCQDNKENIQQQKKQYYKANKENIQQYKKQYYKANKENIQQYYKTYSKQYYKNNKKRIQQHHSQYRKDNEKNIKQYNYKNKGKTQKYNKQYRKKNKEYIKNINKEYQQNNRTTINLRNKKRLKNDKFYAILCRLRGRLSKALEAYSKNGKVKSSSEYGINYNDIIEHLKPFPTHRELFHIDHIKPLSSFDFNNPEEIKKAFAPKNHQWLLKEENLKKGAKIEVQGILN